MLFLGVGRDGSDCVMVLDGGEDGVGVGCVSSFRTRFLAG